MASIRKDKRTGTYLALFRFQGSQYQRSLKTKSRKEALGAIARIEETLALIERGRIEFPDTVDPAEFILSDGRMTKTRKCKPALRLSKLFELYHDLLPVGAKEDSTLKGETIHFKHLRRHFGSSRIVQTIELADIQKYVAGRSLDIHHERTISVDTIKKELSTLRLVWNWALKRRSALSKLSNQGSQLP